MSPRGGSRTLCPTCDQGPEAGAPSASLPSRSSPALTAAACAPARFSGTQVTGADPHPRGRETGSPHYLPLPGATVRAFRKTDFIGVQFTCRKSQPLHTCSPGRAGDTPSPGRRPDAQPDLDPPGLRPAPSGFPPHVAGRRGSAAGGGASTEDWPSRPGPSFPLPAVSTYRYTVFILRAVTGAWVASRFSDRK